MFLQISHTQQNWQQNFLHDINNSLFVLQAHIEELEEKYGSSENTLICLQECKNLQKNVHSYFDLFSLDNGLVNHDFLKKIDISHLINHFCDIYEKGGSIKRNIEKNIYILADEFLLTRIFTILFENAFESANNKHPKIDIQIKKCRSTAVFSIKDNGCAWDEQDQKILFQKYGRTALSKMHGIRGSGLSLFLIKKYLGLLNADIKAIGAKNKGAKFVITFSLIEECSRT